MNGYIVCQAMKLHRLNRNSSPIKDAKGNLLRTYCGYVSNKTMRSGRYNSSSSVKGKFVERLDVRALLKIQSSKQHEARAKNGYAA